MGDRAGYLSFLCAKSEISYRTQQSGGAGGHKCDMEWRHKGGVGLEVTNCKSREYLVASVECVRNLHVTATLLEAGRLHANVVLPHQHLSNDDAPSRKVNFMLHKKRKDDRINRTNRYKNIYAVTQRIACNYNQNPERA